jgi:hypothetical protein
MPLKTIDIAKIFSALAEQMGAWMKDAALLQAVQNENAWFIPAHVQLALSQWQKALNTEDVKRWHQQYVLKNTETKRVGIVAAGNIPLVGLHDLLCVIASNHKAVIKLSKDDERLMTQCIRALNESLPEEKQIEIVDRLKGIDAVIATGSNNTARHFAYYFRNVPALIRQNRSSLAILRGNESSAVLKALASDVFTYFGLGCRNVSKIFVPEGYEMPHFIDHCQGYQWLADQHKYSNNYTYHKAIFLMNQDPHLDNGFMLFRESTELHAPLSVLNYEYYGSSADLKQKLDAYGNQIQIILSESEEGSLPFGTSQHTTLYDYADNVDVMGFLIGLQTGSVTKN